MSQTRYSDDPEIRKVQEHAEQLDIFGILYNIICDAQQASLVHGQTRAKEWENCILSLKLEDFKYTTSKPSGLAYTINMTMPNGTVLFNAQKHDGKCYISDFRFGKWVERITAYSQEVTVQYQKAQQEKITKEKAEKLKPFSEIDF